MHHTHTHKTIPIPHTHTHTLYPCTIPIPIHHTHTHTHTPIHHTPYTIHHTHTPYPYPYTIHQTPYTIHHTHSHTPYTIHHTHTHTPYTIHHTPYTHTHAPYPYPYPYPIHHTPYTIHHTPYTIHHTPYTIPIPIHHTPYTIHHTPYPYTIHHTPYPYPYTIHHTPYTVLIHAHFQPPQALPGGSSSKSSDRLASGAGLCSGGAALDLPPWCHLRQRPGGKSERGDRGKRGPQGEFNRAGVGEGGWGWGGGSPPNICFSSFLEIWRAFSTACGKNEQPPIVVQKPFPREAACISVEKARTIVAEGDFLGVLLPRRFDKKAKYGTESVLFLRVPQVATLGHSAEPPAGALGPKGTTKLRFAGAGQCFHLLKNMFFVFFFPLLVQREPITTGNDNYFSRGLSQMEESAQRIRQSLFCPAAAAKVAQFCAFGRTSRRAAFECIAIRFGDPFRVHGYNSLNRGRQFLTAIGQRIFRLELFG